MSGQLCTFLLLSMPILSSSFSTHLYLSTHVGSNTASISAFAGLAAKPGRDARCQDFAGVMMSAGAKGEYLDALNAAGGEPTDEKALALMETLCNSYQGLAKPVTEAHRGTWITESNYFGPQGSGKNADGDNIYSLGRMSFNMFKPADLLCSLQPVLNKVEKPDKLPDFVPKGLEEDIKSPDLLTYNVEVPYTVEDDRGRGLRGRMLNYGYCLPDPTTPDRLTVFFTGGENQPANPDDVEVWRREFSDAQERRGFRDRVLGWVAGQMMGLDAAREMDVAGKATYGFRKPLGGHGKAFLDVLYLDDDLRITRGNRGSIVVARKQLE